MRVLDIDLDFFLADCCPLAERGARPALAGHEPWAEEKVRAFLEKQCGLDASKPLPGRVFETHDDALRYWEKKVRAGELTVPFGVTHVDAHSDLGIGYPGPGYVLYNVISRPVERRIDTAGYTAQKKLDEANYLLFALAYRWVSSLEDIRNPRSHEDIPGELLESPDSIRLTSLPASLFEKQNGREPPISFSRVDDYTIWKAPEKYDFVTLAMSPRYAPAEADALRDVIARYIREG